MAGNAGFKVSKAEKNPFAHSCTNCSLPGIAFGHDPATETSKR